MCLCGFHQGADGACIAKTNQCVLLGMYGKFPDVPFSPIFPHAETFIALSPTLFCGSTAVFDRHIVTPWLREWLAT